ncbi:MAG TPA: nodulation protein NfeD [Oscillatoriaceae cyanobacterium]
MRRWLLVVLALLSCVFVALPGRAAGDRVAVLTIDGGITPVLASYIERGIRQANDDHDAAVVIDMDTPGGLDSAMRDIIKAIIASNVPVIVYVTPSGSRAASAGMYITVAAHVAAMAPETEIGAAHPVGGGGEDIKGTMGQKVTNDAVAYVKGLATARHRNVKWVEDAVRKSVSLPSTEAVQQHVVDLVAPDLPTLLKKVDGRKIKMNGHTVTLHTRNAELQQFPMTASERFLYTLANPELALILINLGVLGIVFELQNPTGMLAGIVGVIFLLMGFFALGMLPVNGVGVALILFGAALFAMELFVPSYGLLTAGGVISLVLGSLMLFQTNVPGVTPSLPFLMTVSLTTSALVLAGMYMALRAQRRRPVIGKEELLGRVAVARTPLSPAGTVFLEGELWSAQAEGDSVPDGAEVVVDRVEGLKLFVRKKEIPGK